MKRARAVGLNGARVRSWARAAPASMRCNSAYPVSVRLTTFMRLSRGDMRRLTIF
jgi:hypothetical protein